MYGGLQCKNCAVTLKTNHRSEGKLIIDNAIRISCRATPEFDKKRNFSLIQLKEKEHMELGLHSSYIDIQG